MDWIKSNTTLKAVSLLLAIIAWFFVKALTSESRVIDRVPLEIRLPAGLATTRVSATTVEVIVRGTHDDVRQTTRAELQAVLDLTNESRLGPLTYRLDPGNIRHPPRVQVVQVSPARLTLQLEHLLERELPVQPILTGELPPGFTVERTNVIPRKVRIKGPKSLLESLPCVETLPIDLTGRRISFRERVDLAPPDPGIVPLQHTRVEADVRIAETQR